MIPGDGNRQPCQEDAGAALRHAVGIQAVPGEPGAHDAGVDLPGMDVIGEVMCDGLMGGGSKHRVMVIGRPIVPLPLPLTLPLCTRPHLSRPSPPSRPPSTSSACQMGRLIC